MLPHFGHPLRGCSEKTLRFPGLRNSREFCVFETAVLSREYLECGVVAWYNKITFRSGDGPGRMTDDCRGFGKLGCRWMTVDVNRGLKISSVLDPSCVW